MNITCFINIFLSSNYRESCEDPIYEEIDSLDSFLSTSDNSLQVVEEEPCHGPRTKVNVSLVL